MLRKLIKNEFKNEPWNQLILFLFMTLSVTLAVSVCLMLVQLFTSISDMYESAKPPHFLQMHRGEIVQEDIDAFNSAYPGIEYWQSVPMIDVFGDRLQVSGEGGRAFTLEECRLDISLVKQNESYDVLLDENREPLQVGQGEIGVPVILLEQYEIKRGDILTLEDEGWSKTFVVADYVYDGQMNSTLCSSTRFLISGEDFAELFGKAGETEYLIEAYFADSSMGSGYQSAYEQSSLRLPREGQAVTYTMLFLLSAMTDLMMAMVFLLVGSVLIAIALICLRYTLLAKLEEEKREIGTMKALGIPASGIRRLYLVQIRILMAAGCVVGYLLSLAAVSLLTGRMSRTFGKQEMDFFRYALAALVCLLVYGGVMLFAKKILGSLRKATVVGLLATGKGFGKEIQVRDGLHRTGILRKKLSVNFLMGLKEVRHGYGIVFGLLFLTAMLVILPYRIASTLVHENFVTYMGSPVCDALLEAEQGEGLEERKAAAEKLLQAEKEIGVITGYQFFRRVRLQAVNGEGQIAGLFVDTGTGAGKGLQYLSGGAPENGSEIALSCLMSEELAKGVGDTLTVLAGNEEQELTISGIYQDVTSAGRTAKSVREFPGMSAEKYSCRIEMGTAVNKAERIAAWRTQLGNGYSVENMEDFLAQTIGGAASRISQSAKAAFVIGTYLVVLILFLYLRLRINRMAGTLMVKRAMGIPFTDICRQELYPVVLMGTAGIAAGMLAVEVWGDNLVSILLELTGLGLKKLVFAPADLWQWAGMPLIFILVLICTTRLCCGRIRKLQPADYVNE